MQKVSIVKFVWLYEKSIVKCASQTSITFINKLFILNIDCVCSVIDISQCSLPLGSDYRYDMNTVITKANRIHLSNVSQCLNERYCICILAEFRTRVCALLISGHWQQRIYIVIKKLRIKGRKLSWGMVFKFDTQ